MKIFILLLAFVLTGCGQPYEMMECRDGSILIVNKTPDNMESWQRLLCGTDRAYSVQEVLLMLDRNNFSNKNE